MLKTLFLDIHGGRLGRLGFLGYWLLVAGIMFAVALVAGLAAGVTGNADSADFAGDAQALPGSLGVPFLAALAVTVLAILFAELNITAKRVRDIGLPGWPVTFVATALIMLVAVFVSQTVGHGLSLVSWLALVLVPGGTVARR